MSNPQRGEIETVLGGRRFTLRLTLGALAELEAALDGEDLIGFTERLSQGHVAARDLIRLIGAAQRGGGGMLSDDDIAQMMPEGGFAEAVAIAARLIALAFNGAEPADDKKKQKSQPISLAKSDAARTARA